VPVAAYPASGPRELIENGVNGWMDEDLRTAVLKCLDIDRSRCRACAEKFSWQASTEQFLANLEFSQTPFPG
jgi:glycosyltransferase involved in cell wall biosynthesis